MTKEHDQQLAICEKLRKLGYSRARHMRLYGEEFYLISDPIPDGDGFAVRGVARRSGKSRYVRIPLSTVHTLKQEVVFDTELDVAA